MSETTQTNSAEARTETGAIKDGLSSPPTTTPPTPPTSTEMKPETTQSQETKSTTETKDEGKPEPSLLNQDEKKEETKATEGAPEKYETYKVPEGFEIDEATNKEIYEMFKGMNLNQANAQKLVDTFAAKMIEAQEAPFKYWKDMNDK